MFCNLEEAITLARRSFVKTCFCLRLMVLLLAADVANAVAQSTAPQPLPIALAYSHKQLRRSDRPTTSPDHRWLAYEVFTPPVRSPKSTQNAGRFLPNGTPAESVGTNIEVVATLGGPSHAVCEEGTNCWRPSWSPDSRSVAFYSDQSGFPQLWIYDVERAKSRRVSEVPIKAKLWVMDKPVWDPAGREIFVPIVPSTAASPSKPSQAASNQDDGPTVSVYQTESGAASAKGTDGPTGLPDQALLDFLVRENNATLGAVDVVTGKSRILVDAEAEPRPSSLKLSPDGRWMSYLSVFRIKGTGQTETFYDLALVPSKGGGRIVVESDLEATDRDYYDEPYLWSRDSKYLVFTKGKRLWVSEISAGGASKPHQLAASLGEINEFPFLLSADGHAALIGLKPQEEQGYYVPKSTRLALVPLDGSAPQTFDVSGQPITSDSGTLWQPNANKFDLISEDSSTGERAIEEVDVRTGKAGVKWRGRARVSPAGTASNGNLLVRFEDGVTPPDYFRFGENFSGPIRLTDIEPQLAHTVIGPMESFEVTVPVFDGNLRNVRTSIFLPPKYKKGERLPAIVYFYAGSQFSEYAQDFGGGAPNSIPVQLFATRGYAVLFVDVPLGPQGTGGNPLQEMTDAVLPQVYRASELGYIDIDQVAIMGQSYGGYSTVGIASQTNLFRAAMALDGMYDLPGLYARMYPDGGAVNFLWSESGQGRMGTHPWADLKRYLANSPYYLADKIHTPVLLIHGADDDACPVDDAKKMFNALKRLNRTAELAVYAGEGHVPGEWSLVNAVDATERMLAFLKLHVKSPERGTGGD